MITVTKSDPTDGATLTFGDVECYDLGQGDQCDLFGHPENVEAGALSGRDVWTDSGGVTVTDAARTAQITNSNSERARELAETFTTL
jgi:hypothetical protein